MTQTKMPDNSSKKVPGKSSKLHAAKLGREAGPREGCLETYTLSLLLHVLKFGLRRVSPSLVILQEQRSVLLG